MKNFQNIILKTENIDLDFKFKDLYFRTRLYIKIKNINSKYKNRINTRKLMKTIT